jgi:hypothetical protein
VVAGNASFDNSGFSVSGAGDGDGFAGVVVGAYYDDTNEPDPGSARVVSGIDGSTLYTFNGDSRLILAQSENMKKASNENGFFYFRELTKLDFQGEMFVLSACSTNDGVPYPTESIMGLAQGWPLGRRKECALNSLGHRRRECTATHGEISRTTEQSQGFSKSCLGRSQTLIRVLSA